MEDCEFVMNVFYTNDCPKQSALDHCRIHRNKMIVEYAQLLSTAHHLLGVNALTLYKMTHKNHPSAAWVRQSASHYRWVWQCAMHLCELYYHHTGKTHKTYAILKNLEQLPVNLYVVGFSRPPVAAPEVFKRVSDVCLAYQSYLNYKFSEWRNRDKPLNVVFDNTPTWYVCI